MASDLRKEWRDAKSQLDQLGIDLHKQFKAMGISPQDLGPALDPWEKAVEAYDNAKGGSSEEQKAKKQMKTPAMPGMKVRPKSFKSFFSRNVLTFSMGSSR